jgi:creatinine amidohydrolase
MDSYILAETNWKALGNADIEMAILPWGATEAHNFHLPYSTDNIEKELQGRLPVWHLRRARR